MKAVAQSYFNEAVFQLLKEAFEGPAPTGPSAFLNKGTGLFQTLDSVSAQVASTQSRPVGSTVAAHSEHVRFYVEVHQKLLQGSTEPIDWDTSWRLKTVNSAEWDVLRQELRRAYANLIEYLRGVSNWGEDEIDVSMAVIAHTAYHLGAIRQLIVALKSHSSET
jgi:hypothetical protein